LKIPAGKVQGMMIISATADAKPAFSVAEMIGHAQIEGAKVTRPCPVASMEWPAKDAKQEIPSPRLMADVPVSVTDSEGAPLTVAAAEEKVWEATAGQTLKIPLKATWRNEFTDGVLKLKAYATQLGAIKEVDLPIKAAGAELVLDLAALKTAPGDYSIALYGSAVSKYRYNPEAVKLAEAQQKKVEQELAAIAAASKKLTDEATNAPAEKKSEMASAAKAAVEKQKQTEALMTQASTRMKAATTTATPKDTVDIIVSRPIHISVKPAAPAPTTPAVAASPKA
jgi:hypothetical protein